MDLRFTCSHLRRTWKSLYNDHNLCFGEYGDWPLIFSKPQNEDILVWLVVIEDIIPNEILFSRLNTNIKRGKEIIDKAIELLKLRLKNNQLIFVAYVSESHDSVIRYSRSIPTTKILETYFQSQLFSLVSDFPKLYTIPLSFSFSKEGINNCFDSRNFYLARIRFSQLGIKIISNEIRSIINRIKKPAAKVLVLDCDNTLWGGVVGESGISKILIGQDGIGKSFQAFQSGIKELSGLFNSCK